MLYTDAASLETRKPSGKAIIVTNQAKTSNSHGILFAMLPMAVAALIGAMLGSYARHNWHCARQAWDTFQWIVERSAVEVEMLPK